MRPAEDKEINKLLYRYKALRPISQSEVEPTAAYLRSMALYKLKLSTGVVAGRIPLDGSRQPADTYNDTFAATSDTFNRLFLLSVSLKDAAHRDCLRRLVIGGGDIPAAFINNVKLTREHTGGRQIITRLPRDLLNKTLAGTLCAVDNPL